MNLKNIKITKNIILAFFHSVISLIEFMGATQKIKFSIKDFFSNLVTFTEEIFNGKLNFLCSGGYTHGLLC